MRSRHTYYITLLLLATCAADWAYGRINPASTEWCGLIFSTTTEPHCATVGAGFIRQNSSASVPTQGNGSRCRGWIYPPETYCETDTVPDSLKKTRWRVQHTVPLTEQDLKSGTADLRQPSNLKWTVELDTCSDEYMWADKSSPYSGDTITLQHRSNDTLVVAIDNDKSVVAPASSSQNRTSQPQDLKTSRPQDLYLIGTKLGGKYLSVPLTMTPDEFRQWSERRQRCIFFRTKNLPIEQKKEDERFSFKDMRFSLGPAERIFGPGGVRITTRGTAELSFGATMRNIDNPSLPVRNRKTTALDFDEKINLNVNGKVGDKVDMNLNYNTDATFDFDTQNLKLKYEGKDDEIIKLVEGGNISFPSNSSLIRGSSALFGLRTDLQFGRLKLQTVVSQKKSSARSVSSQGGVQTTPFDIDVTDYEENRHFFLATWFRDHYDAAMSRLPNITTGININRIEIWVTNNTNSTADTRDIIALTDLGENTKVSNQQWSTLGQPVPGNNANNEYQALTTTYSAARNINQAATVLDAVPGLQGGTDYERLESARRLSESEYTLNSQLGYVSLNTAIESNQVVAVAYEFTYGGTTYQVGEFASDIKDAQQALYVKALKNTSNNPQQGNWPLMMKNVYRLASAIEKDQFRLDVKFQSDTSGVYLSYIPEQQVKSQTLLKLIGADRLDNNNHANSNGRFDYVEGFTVSNGRVFLPKVEPFGAALLSTLTQNGVSAGVARKYCFTELYDSTRTTAKQIAEKDKYRLQGQFRGTTTNTISLGAAYVPQGSVVVTAGGLTLTEGSDYTVDYSAGEVTILNQSILDAGTAINVSLENAGNLATQRKTMLGMNWEYEFSRNFQLSGTIQHLSEQALTTKVHMGQEPLNNTLWGININWKKESQWLTDMLNKLPFTSCSAPSNISFTGEFAQLIAGQPHGVQGNASYVDDFENTKSVIDVSVPSSWVLSSVPSMFPEQQDKTTLSSGFNRSQMAWYNIDPLFTRRSSSLTPSHIKSDLDQLSNYYVREWYYNELFPNRDYSNYSGSTQSIPVLNVAYYPNERGPYNFNPELNSDGTLPSPENHWGGMMRKLDTNDFETANIEYIEFWLLDPFIYTNEQADAAQYGGDFYINLGEISEDILRDGRKFYESGMPVDGSESFTTTQWGRIPTQTTATYGFATTAGARALQDVGYNGLTDQQEREFASYQDFLTKIQSRVSQQVLDSIMADPANDDYHYFRGSDFDQNKTPILQRYKRINNPQGNSPDSDNRTESYDTSYKTTPDVEDINQDYTLNEYERYYQYRISVRPQDLVVGQNFIVDKRETAPVLRNGAQGRATWYQFRIPLSEYEKRVGGISDFTSVRFMRMFLTNFKRPVVLRFANLDLVRGEWRVYEQSLSSTSGESGSITAGAVSLEENSEKTPVNYVMPPGISREQDPTQPQLTESNEQALDMVVNNLSSGESKAVYKNTMLDLRQYKKLQMFVHANTLEQNTTELKDDELAVFIRLGSDYRNNYYEYEIPLKLTAAGQYNRYSAADCQQVWPEDNMLDIPLSLFTNLKKARNKAKTQGLASYNALYTAYDEDKPRNKISILGNPSLGEVKTMIIGVRNLSGDTKSGEVWVNELRLKEFNSTGGWAARANLNVQLSDIGSFNASGKIVTEGFGSLEDGVAERSQDDYKTYSITTSLDLGRFVPAKAKLTAPFYYSITQEQTRPKYNPLDTDITLDDALEGASAQEKDSIESIAITKTKQVNLSLSNVRFDLHTKKHPMPYDLGNFTFSYSHSSRHTSGETTVYEDEKNWRGVLNYSYSPTYKTFEPFSKVFKSKSRWFDILRQFGLNYLPQSVVFNTEMLRNYYELQERDMETMSKQGIPLTFSSQFLWNRELSLRWDITKNLHLNFNSATHAEIEEPYTAVNKDLYPDHYSAWKDSVWTSIKHLGRPLDYNQTFTASYRPPINLIPIFDWITTDANYNATYNWTRGTDLDDGTSLGNVVSMNRLLNVNGTFNLVKLYNHIPFLKEVNDRFSRKASQKTQQRRSNDTPVVGGGNDKSVVAPTPKANKSKTNKTSKPQNLILQYIARGLMSIRDVSVSYRNQYSMYIPGFMPDVGDAFGQKHGDIMTPGLGFAFGFVGDGYVDRCRERGWLLMADSIATPATTSLTEDVQVRMTVEPVRNLKIDLNAARTETKAKSIQYMYTGTPTTQSGTLTMTTLSLRSAFEGLGNAHNGYHSASFERFCNSLDAFRSRIEERYTGAKYPAGTTLAGKPYDPQNGAVSKYGADVMVPAFLSAYTSMGGKKLSIFPSIARMLPNWTMRYSGLGQLAWFRDVFKSVNLNHSYKSIYAVGSYSSYSTYQEYMNGMGFIVDQTTGNPTPSSMFNVSTVSINEAFAPLLGVDMTFQNNLTCKVEYRQTRVLSLSMASIQINEAVSRDWVCGLAYRVNDFNFFGLLRRKTAKTSRSQSRKTAQRRSNGTHAVATNDDKSVAAPTSRQNNRKTSTRSFNSELNLKLDLSYRRQAAITRDIATITSTAGSGNTAFKLSFTADYALSRMLTVSFYYDRQTNKPLLSSTSYPTTTQDFGLSMKFSLTR